MSKYNIPIVMYHCINEHTNENPLGFLSFSPKQFAAHLSFFKKAGFQFITLSELYQLALSQELGNLKVVVLTFDDGFLDNYSVAADIMKNYGAKGTIFVNPDFACDGSVRNISDLKSHWGQLNYCEMGLLESQGIFDIQSHTMTHDWEFKSDKVIDVYTKEKFSKYYWLAWKLFPAMKPFWCETIDELRSNIPEGYPVFEYGRSLSTRRFMPATGFVSKCLDIFQKQKMLDLLAINNCPDKGSFETKKEWAQRAEFLLKQAKVVLEEKLNKSVDHVCFPGGSYNEMIVEMAEKEGYKSYMVSSKDQSGNNLHNICDALASKQIMKLKRISFTKHYPTLLPDELAAYWAAKLKVGVFMGSPWASCLLRGAKTFRRCMHSS